MPEIPCPELYLINFTNKTIGNTLAAINLETPA
jgi:hypothetical protein